MPAHSVNLRSQVSNLNEPKLPHAYLIYARVIGNICKFPMKGKVRGPGGNPGSRDPILRIRFTNHPTSKINATIDGDMVKTQDTESQSPTVLYSLALNCLIVHVDEPEMSDSTSTVAAFLLTNNCN